MFWKTSPMFLRTEHHLVAARSPSQSLHLDGERRGEEGSRPGRDECSPGRRGVDASLAGHGFDGAPAASSSSLSIPRYEPAAGGSNCFCRA